MFEPNDDLTIQPDTDDLDAFQDLFSGKAKAPEQTEDDDHTDPVTPDPEDNDDGDDDGQKPDPDEDGEKDPNEKPRKVNKVQERINKVLEKERLARERAEALEREVAELKKASEASQKAPASTQEQDGPTPEDKNDDGSEKYPLGEFDPQYNRDLTRYIIQKEQAAAREEQLRADAQRQEQEARAALDNQWRERLEPVTEKYDDFIEKAMELDTTFESLDSQYADYLVQTIKSLDHGPEVLYYFANNLDEAQKFVRMGPLAATLALGEYNAMFKGQATRKETKVSNAPPPPQVNKGSNTRKAISGDTDDLDAFEKAFYASKRR